MISEHPPGSERLRIFAVCSCTAPRMPRSILSKGTLNALSTLPGGHNAQAYWINSRGEIIGFSGCTPMQRARRHFRSFVFKR